MADACHEGLIAKFDQLISKLQTRIMKKERLQVSENGTYTAPENTGYTVVDVNVASSAPVNLQPMKECVLETPTQGFDGVLVTPDEGYDGLESVKCFAPTAVFEATENGTYRPREGHIGFSRVDVNVPPPYTTYLYASQKKVYTAPEGTVWNEVDTTLIEPNVPTYVRGSGRVNVRSKTMSTAGKQSIMSVNVMEVDAIPLDTMDAKINFLYSTLMGYVTGRVTTETTGLPFTQDGTTFEADIELIDDEGFVFNSNRVSFTMKEKHQMRLVENNQFHGTECVVFFERPVMGIFHWSDIENNQVTACRLSKIYCEVTPTQVPLVVAEGAYVYVCVVSPKGK